jgi:hypothetical protein
MPSITPKPTLQIQPGNPIGKFLATVKWSVSWDSYDVASGQPYTADVKVFGYDPGLAPSPQHITSKAYTIKPGDALPRTDTFTVDYGFLNEDLGQDEIRASVTLTPIAPKIAGPTSSDEVVLNLA